MSTELPEVVVCAVCSRVLDRFEEDLPGGGTEDHWIHTADIRLREEDHPPVPVLPGALASVDFKCDLCFAPNPTWVLPAETFEYPGAPGNFSEGNWALCDECASLYRRGYLDRLSATAIRRSVQFTGPIDPMVALLTKLMHRELWKHVTGDPYPYEGSNA
jgi:hypothetical protein